MKAIPTMKKALKSVDLKTKEEFDKLLSTTGAGKDSSSIRDTSWSSGSNSSGFGALPAGRRWDNPAGFRWNDGVFSRFGSGAYFWSATPDGNVNAYYLSVLSDYASVYNLYRDHAFSVRCLQDSN